MVCRVVETPRLLGYKFTYTGRRRARPPDYVMDTTSHTRYPKKSRKASLPAVYNFQVYTEDEESTIVSSCARRIQPAQQWNRKIYHTNSNHSRFSQLRSKVSTKRMNDSHSSFYFTTKHFAPASRSAFVSGASIHCEL